LNNNELLKVILNSLDVTSDERIKILKLGDVIDEVIIENVLTECDNETLEAFLNGFIVYKRGPKEEETGMNKKAPLPIKVRKSINNVVFKKLKIAFALTNDDIIEIFEEANVKMTKNDLTTYLRKEGHKHYRSLEAHYLKVFMEGAANR
jgi:uncharacterized protein YehS (DUF1456 family)